MSELSGSAPIRGYKSQASEPIAPTSEVNQLDVKILQKLQGTLAQFSSVKRSGKVEIKRKALAEDLQAYEKESNSAQLKKTLKKIQSFMKLIDKDASHGLILNDLEKASYEISRALPIDNQAHLSRLIIASRNKLAEVFKGKGMDEDVVDLVAEHQIQPPKRGLSLSASEIEQKQKDYEHIISAWSLQAPIR